MMKHDQFIVLSLVVTAWFSGTSLDASAQTKTATLYPEPDADGFVVDSDRDGLGDRIAAPRVAQELRSGASFGGLAEAVIEFDLETSVPAGSHVVSAEFRLVLNGTYGCYPDEAGGGPELDLWSYTLPQADGLVEVGDASVQEAGQVVPVGTRIEQLLAGGEEMFGGNEVKLDVTEAVRAAVVGGETAIGIRLESPENFEGVKVKTWRWRSREFGDRHGLKDNAPQLRVTYAPSAPEPE